MEAYTFSEARQNLSSILDQAKEEGSVRITRRDGTSFILTPEKMKKSPLDVQGVNLNLSTEEIIEYIHEGRKS